MVDDDPIELRLALRCHAQSGLAHPLKTFAKPEPLLEHLDGVIAGRAPTPALILVDVRMPRMNGFEVVEAIRAREPLRDLPPIAMLTTSTLRADRERAVVLGCAAYLVKPSKNLEFVALFKAMAP